MCGRARERRDVPAAEETALDDFDDERCRFLLTHLRIKPSSGKKDKEQQDEQHLSLSLSLTLSLCGPCQLSVYTP